MNALERAIKTAPTMTEFAKRLGVTPQVVTNWRRRGIPVERVLDIERVSGVSRYVLRPDIYPRETVSA